MPSLFFKAVPKLDFSGLNDVAQWTVKNKTKLKVGSLYAMFLLASVFTSHLEKIHDDSFGIARPAANLSEAASTVALSVASDAAMNVLNRFR